MSPSKHITVWNSLAETKTHSASSMCFWKLSKVVTYPEITIKINNFIPEYGDSEPTSILLIIIDLRKDAQWTTSVYKLWHTDPSIINVDVSHTYLWEPKSANLQVGLTK